MIPKIDPTQTSSWKKLKAHYAEMKSVQMKTLFANDPERFEKMSILFNDIIFDYTTQETMTNAHTAREWFLTSAQKSRKFQCQLNQEILKIV